MKKNKVEVEQGNWSVFFLALVRTGLFYAVGTSVRGFSLTSGIEMFFRSPNKGAGNRLISLLWLSRSDTGIEPGTTRQQVWACCLLPIIDVKRKERWFQLLHDIKQDERIRRTGNEEIREIATSVEEVIASQNSTST